MSQVLLGACTGARLLILMTYKGRHHCSPHCVGKETEAQKVSSVMFAQVLSWQSQDLDPHSRPGLPLTEGTTWPSYQTSQPVSAQMSKG